MKLIKAEFKKKSDRGGQLLSGLYCGPINRHFVAYDSHEYGGRTRGKTLCLCSMDFGKWRFIGSVFMYIYRKATGNFAKPDD